MPAIMVKAGELLLNACCKTDLENFEFEIARKFVNQTGCHIFLTGNAGTGKTTFLREVIGQTSKNCVVVAPTGVAAINAGGVTIHSMFGLPTKAYAPGNEYVDPNLANNIQMLSGHFHYNRQKLDVIKELELLVIDEVSMVRADLLDAVDYSLRFTRKNTKPFGGVQVLFIGDMYQLPPVVKDDEWPLLSKYYSGPYFFDSHVFRNLDPVYIELKKIYRQSDRTFIQILNNIRHQDFQQEDYEILAEHYNSKFEPDEPGYITLTTHNKKADVINESELAKLKGEEVIFDADVSGDFYDNMFPTERLLRLKEGAQVMFVKNDTSGERKYFNGKIGIIERIDEYGDEDEILSVRFPDTGEIISVAKELWENIKYSVNPEDQKLEQNRIGSFEQYPLRLAWAITIHKSQGLTFDKAVIDAGESFAPGQVYVALSRCTSMDNLVLKSMISNRNIFSDPRIVEFSGRIMKDYVLENRLEESEKEYAYTQLLKTFDFTGLHAAIGKWDKAVSRLKSVSRAETYSRSRECHKAVDGLQDISGKFHVQLQGIFNADLPMEKRFDQLKQRSIQAIKYFTSEFYIKIITDWDNHLELVKYKAKLKKYVKETTVITNLFWNKLESLYDCQLENERIFPESETRIERVDKPVAKKAKGSTYDDTLDLFQSGKTIHEIAEIRNMAASTIEGHMSKLIASGKVDVSGLLSKDKLDMIKKVAAGNGKSVSDIKAKLGEKASWAEIRWVLAAN